MLSFSLDPLDRLQQVPAKTNFLWLRRPHLRRQIEAIYKARKSSSWKSRKYFLILRSELDVTVFSRKNIVFHNTLFNRYIIGVTHVWSPATTRKNWSIQYFCLIVFEMNEDKLITTRVFVDWELIWFHLKQFFAFLIRKFHHHCQ